MAVLDWLADVIVVSFIVGVLSIGLGAVVIGVMGGKVRQ